MCIIYSFVCGCVFVLASLCFAGANACAHADIITNQAMDAESMAVYRMGGIERIHTEPQNLLITVFLCYLYLMQICS